MSSAEKIILSEVTQLPHKQFTVKSHDRYALYELRTSIQAETFRLKINSKKK